MIRRRNLIIGLSSVVVTSTGLLRAEVQRSGTYVQIDEYRLLYDSDAAVSSVLTTLPKHDVTLLLPKGEWQFKTTERPLFFFEGFSRLTIDGSGSLLIFNGNASPFHFSECKDVVLKNFSVDWKDVPFNVGRVASVSESGKKVAVNTERPYLGEQISAVNQYDEVTHLPTIGGFETYEKLNQVASIGTSLNLSFANSTVLAVGDFLLIRYRLDRPVIHFMLSEMISVLNVTVLAGSGMAFVADFCRGVDVRKFHVQRGPKGDRYLSTNADAIHCGSCSGDINITDCRLDGMGDDGINVHSKYYESSKVFNDRSLLVSVRGAAQSSLMEVGRPLHIFDKKLSMSIEAKVQTSHIVDGGLLLVFVKDFPDDLDVGFVYDPQTESRCSILSCTISGNRGRAILAHRNTQINKCHLSNQSEQAILLTVDSSFEGPTISDVSVKNSVITGSMRREPSAAIDIGVRSHIYKGALPRDFRSSNIFVMQNLIDVGGLVLRAAGCSHLEFVSNKIKGHAADGIVVVLQSCSDLEIFANLAPKGSSYKLDGKVRDL